MSKQLTSKSTVLVNASTIPVAGDVITTDNNVLVSPKTKNITYKDMGNGAQGNEKSLINDDYVTAEFSLDVIAKPASAAGVAPSIAQLFKICGLSETVEAGVSVIYAPSSTSLSGKATAYLDGSKRDITGIAGDFGFSGTIGGTLKFSFSLKGFTTLEETTEANPTVTLDTAEPFVIKSITALTVGGSELDIESFDFSMAAAIEEIYAANRKEFYISDFKPNMKMKGVKTKGNQAHWSELKANTKKALIVTLGSEAGKKLTFSAPYCAPVDVSENESGGKVVYERTWNCQNNTGNDNFQIKYS